MPLFAGFCGPAYRTRSENLDAEQLINLYLETITNSGNAKKSNLYGTPGNRPLLTVGTSGCRGCFAQDGVILITVGPILYSLDLVNTIATSLGIIRDDGLPVTYASNGRGGEQVAIVGGNQLKVLTLTTMSLSAVITLPLTDAPVMIAFLDGYGLLLEANTVRVWFSALEDFTSWSALDFFARSQVSDNLVGLKVLRDKIWTFGTLTTEVFYDSGDLLNPFVPFPGSIMQEGLVSPWAVGVQGEALLWMSQDNEGRGRVVSAVDFAPTRISTPALDYALASYPTLTDAEILVYEKEGHAFACWSLPTAGVTWCYDARESSVRQEPIWHQRDTFDDALALSSAWGARGVCSTDAGILVGDRHTGAISLLDLNIYTDASGNPIRRTRTAPYVSAENQWLFLDQIELGMQAGVGIPAGQGSAPLVMAEISRDGGHSFDPPMTASLGALGAYLEPAIWYQCGRVRSDRFVLRVTQSDPIKTVWGPGLWLRVTPGSGQL